MISIAVTGHRPDKLWGYDLNHPKYKELESLIMKEIAKIILEHQFENPIECISGMALGVDTIFAKAVLKMRMEAPESIRLIAAVPCIEQDKLWRGNDKTTYKNILSLSDEVVHVSKEPYTKGCMNARNQYMIDRCNVLLAVWNGDKIGGTADAVKRAERAGKEIVRIDPRFI